MSKFHKLVAAIMLGGTTLAASATSYSGITIFGDSLTDTGNVFAASGGSLPLPPYFNGRFSNGPVWAEYLASGLGFASSSNAVLMGGNNYAFGGARIAVNGSVPSLLGQMVGYWSPGHPVADPNALYVVVGGGNDMRDARSAFQTDSAADNAGRQAAAQTAANGLINGLSFLASKSAKHVLIANLPDLGNTPEAAVLGLQFASHDASVRFNGLMGSVLASGASFGLDMHFLDMAGLADAIRNDALGNGGATYGITNVFTPCAPFPGNIGISCNVSAFSDALHPSARAQQLLGYAALQAVPEPETYAQMALGLVALAVVARRRRRA